jgi:hypothetical protein
MKPDILNILHTRSVPTSQYILCVSVIKTEHTSHTNAFCGQEPGFVESNADGTCCDYCALNIYFTDTLFYTSAS